MDVLKNKKKPVGNKEWENPNNPEKPADARDEEQLLRQLKEAGRRKDNLTDKDKKEKTN
ncbi:MAG: hypothetical protein ABIN95_13130 [Mucilaginibacter sp.]